MLCNRNREATYTVVNWLSKTSKYKKKLVKPTIYYDNNNGKFEHLKQDITLLDMRRHK